MWERAAGLVSGHGQRLACLGRADAAVVRVAHCTHARSHSPESMHIFCTHRLTVPPPLPSPLRSLLSQGTLYSRQEVVTRSRVYSVLGDVKVRGKA